MIESYLAENFEEGCYLDRSASSADSLNQDTISFAARFGFDIGEPLPEKDDEDYSQALSEAADKALEHLNTLEYRDDFVWTFEDNSLFLCNNFNQRESL